MSYINRNPEWKELNAEFDIKCTCPKIHVYCDGAASNNGRDGAKAGWGVYFEDPDLHYRNAGGPVIGKQTNQRAELKALFEAIIRAPLPGQLYIHTDSMYAIDCVSKWRDHWETNNYTTANRKSVANRDLIDDIMKARRERKTKVVLMHVSGHSGDDGNDAADIIAKNASNGHYE